jgi:hypothetical protein
MDFKQRTLHELRSHRQAISGKHVLSGFDGFVDTIVAPVATRAGHGESFSAMTTISELGGRILAAAGKSTNIELYPRMDKLGGNGPIMANALLAAGTSLTYVGALGKTALHPVFQEMAARSEVISFADPGSTIAVEFTDGKIMLGLIKSLDDVTFAQVLQAMGEDRLKARLQQADLVALVNWTMLPHMTGIFEGLLERILPTLPAKPSRRFFFDLADPEKRTLPDLVHALRTIGRFNTFGPVTLGLNLKEAQQVYPALGLGSATEDEAGLRKMASDIRACLGVDTVVIHPKESAACATPAGTAWVPGPYVDRPLITTGAGDHFNAGFSTGQLLGLSPEACLGLGVCTSGHYVRTAQSPSLDHLETFLANWK